MRYFILFGFFLSCSTEKLNFKPSKKTLKVLIIDTGLNPYIPALRPYLGHYNQLEIMDENNHGSHIAGIIAAQACPGVEIIPCKAAFDYKKGIECFKLALFLNVDVINFSMGGYASEEHEFNIIKALEKAGITVVAAAGNDNLDLSIKPYYPASYNLRNIVAVGALLPNGQKTGFSNYGPKVVWEPGFKVKSFNRFGGTMEMSGTSQATAIYTSKIVRKFCERNN